MSLQKRLLKLGIDARDYGKVTFPGLIQATNLPALVGNVFYVDSTNGTDDSNHGGGPGTEAFATIDYAIGKCTADNGDVIFVMPGHEETVEDSDELELDVAGISIIGIGRYDSRPKIILDTATDAAAMVSAADILMQNFVFEASFADVVCAVDVRGKGFHLDQCHFQEEGANLNFVDYVVAPGADNTADGLKITNCTGYGIDAAINSPLRIANNLDDLVFENNYFNTDHANALAMIQCATGGILANCYVVGNFYASLKASGDILIDNDVDTNSGIVAYNNAISGDTAGEVLCDCDGVGLFENRHTAVVTASGYLLPAVDS